MKRQRPSTNLRSAPTSFVGRAADVTAVAEQLGESRLVTILGPGGMGKTTLARRIGEERLPSYVAHRGGGVWFCDLSEARSRDDIVASVAATLDVDLRGDAAGMEMSRALGRAIALRGRILIVLDNFDRLAAEAEDTVGAWLAEAKGARFLVTSRVALDLPGERLWSLRPLPRSEAAELFVRRAKLVQAAFDGERERDTVVAIVDAVDRMPLAIELAATRMSLLSASQLQSRLARPLDVLKDRRGVGKHASMRRTVLDSVELLEPSARHLFASCAIMRNGFTLEAAEGIFGDVVVPRSAILDELDALVRHCLVQVAVEEGDHAARYSLFETIRDVAEELAPSYPDLRGRHSTYYASRAREALACTGGATFSRSDLENLHAAHRGALALAVDEHAPDRALEVATIALALEAPLSKRGLLRVRAAFLSDAFRALDHVGDGNVRLRAELHLAQGSVSKELGESAAAHADFERGLSLANDADEPLLAAIALTRIGEMHDVASETATARDCFDRALRLLEGNAPSAARARHEADTYLGLGHALRREGALGQARAAIAFAVARYREVAHGEGLASGLYELAVVEMFAGAHDAAFAHFDEGLRVARRGEMDIVAGALKTARGSLLQDLGRLDEALAHHADAAQAFHEVGSRHREASALYYLATTYLELGQATEALAVLARAGDLLEGVGASRYEALVAGAMATARAIAADREGAEQSMVRAERAADRAKSEPALAATIAVHRMGVDLLARGGEGRDAVLAEARRLVAEAPNDDSRFALRVLERANERRERDALEVWAGGAAFRLPGASDAVGLPERSPLRAILVHLAERRIAAPGELVTIDDVVRVGWPSERIAAEAALNRAYVALATLRKLGLRGLLVNGRGGYFLSIAAIVRARA
jgi:predicted ATPase